MVREKPGFPAQLDTGHVSQLGAGDHRVDAQIDLDLLQSLALIGEGHDLVAARLKQARNDQACRAARIDTRDTHACLWFPNQFRYWAS